MSASGQLARKHSVSSSSRGRAANMQDFTMSPNTMPRYFEPSAATASMFLYVQGNAVVCCHHDTLTIERRFSRHSEEIQLLAVDNQSETGAGRLVVSYDAGQTAIVWDIMTGDEVARFVSYEALTVAAWMRNGNVAFGNAQGNIILFEPETSEHISSRTIDQIAVTAIAPAADCRTFALGYQNGSLLIATLQPRFTILHNLTTARGPSAIMSVSWHASSSRQKSDMLAVQTHDGDLRVWSVAKSYNNADPAKVVRILKKTERYAQGPNWMGWSKNGRIIQYSDSETLSWDVRTKHVTYDSIPTLEHVRGLAVYGPGATLFTLGANNTVQQFDLNAPAMITANVQHPSNTLPPSPPVSIEEQDKGAQASETESESIPIQITSESEEEHMSPIARMVQATEHSLDGQPYRAASEVSSRSHVSSVSQSSATSKTPGRYQGSVVSRGLTENTYISAGSSVAPSEVTNHRYRKNRDSYSTASLSSISMTSTSTRSHHRPSRLRNEMIRSPEASIVEDLFKFTRSRLSDIPYKHPTNLDNSRLTNDDLRRQMLSTIFGWNRDIKELVRDEMSRHPHASNSRIMLLKWLGDLDSDPMATDSANMTSSDWMRLALSGIGGAKPQQASRYVQRLLEAGDVHAAVTLMLGMGDQNDAVEVYLSHKKYLEALILACLSFPSVWERQSQIIKIWGEWAVLHGQQELAIRCFSCAGRESTEPWTSPSAAQISFPNIAASIPEILSPPLSPPGLNRGPQRNLAKSSALKLITTFGETGSKSKFFATDGGQTPIAAGVTPIAESAISPGIRVDPATALLRPSNNSAFNTPASARPIYGRQRLPSIGELSGDATHRNAAKNIINVPPPAEKPVARPRHEQSASMDETLASGLSLPRAATASPMMMRDSRSKKEAPPPSPSPASLAVLMDGRSSRNGPRNRIPDGINMQLGLPSMDDAVNEAMSPQTSAASSKYHWPIRRRGPGSVASSITSASSVARSHRGRHAGGKSLDDYIHSLEAAKTRGRASSQDRIREGSRVQRAASRESSRDRGRAPSRGYTPRPAKRSPTSPVPMSPEDLINLSTPRVVGADVQVDENGTHLVDISPDENEPGTVVRPGQVRRSSKTRVSSRNSNRSTRRRSIERRPTPLDLARGRSNAREGSAVRSPSSPLPMAANAQLYTESDDQEDYRKALEAQEKFRAKKSRNESRTRDRSESRHRSGPRESPENRVQTPGTQQFLSEQHDKVGDLRQMKDERSLKKEAAARELEERRKSLALRALGTPVFHPDELSPAFELPSRTFVASRDLPTRSQTVEPGATRSMYANRNGPALGLPATPKAMRLVMDSDAENAPSVPAIPANFAQGGPRSSGSSKDCGDLPSLTLLPSTVYSPPSRPLIPRSLSAPPEEPMVPRDLQGSYSKYSSRSSQRKLSTADSNNLDALIDNRRSSRRPSQDNNIPPPPPPPPAPILKELQHLAMPPPPPPAPLPHGQGNRPPVYGSGMIEIVRDDDPSGPAPSPPLPPAAVPVAVPVSEATVPIIAPPAPPSSRNGHRRGRSSVDQSISGRLSRATERMRSASRGRNLATAISRTKSPEISQPMMAPYESIPAPPPVNYPQYQGRGHQQQPQQLADMRTGLHESEMI